MAGRVERFPRARRGRDAAARSPHRLEPRALLRVRTRCSRGCPPRTTSTSCTATVRCRAIVRRSSGRPSTEGPSPRRSRTRGLFAVQFHPEKSQWAGKRLLDAFAAWVRARERASRRETAARRSRAGRGGARARVHARRDGATALVPALEEGVPTINKVASRAARYRRRARAGCAPRRDRSEHHGRLRGARDGRDARRSDRAHRAPPLRGALRARHRRDDAGGLRSRAHRERRRRPDRPARGRAPRERALRRAGRPRSATCSATRSARAARRSRARRASGSRSRFTPRPRARSSGPACFNETQRPLLEQRLLRVALPGRRNALALRRRAREVGRAETAESMPVGATTAQTPSP